MNTITDLYTAYAGRKPSRCERIAGGGSSREYYRITEDTGHTLVGSVGTSIEENNTFIYLTRHFREKGLPVPEIFAVSGDGLAYLQSDLGNTTLYEALKTGRENPCGYSAGDIRLLEEAVALLPKIQVAGAKGLDFTKCYPQEAMDEQNVMFDLNYFKYCFLKTTSIDFNEQKLEQDFRDMARELGGASSHFFMYRDFQARNVMLGTDGTLSFIDYQGGRRGPLQYDLVSFLWQASSHFDEDTRNHLTDVYIESLKNYADIDEASFRNSIPRWVLFRILQVLGAYGLRGRYERKKYFLDSIPAAIRNLAGILKVTGACPYPYLYGILERLVSLPEFACDGSSAPKSVSATGRTKGMLKVRVYSFSYKKGIPEDVSGNGGGYVFDCRMIHNPGRYEPYKHLTGLDKPVADFLENGGEMAVFLQNIYNMADSHVERYMKRGFTSLMFSFGCTGGQHRSVYGAQHLAEHIHSKYGIEVEVNHREQGITSILPARRKAMIFAAGLGTRLKPLTDSRPKALVEVCGKPLIEHVLERLVSCGFNDIVVNVHHYADMLEKWGEGIVNNGLYENAGLRITFSDERKELLDTGGGISNALPLLACANPDSKVLVHNVDILSNVDFRQFCSCSDSSASAILLVSKRKTARYLVFDDDMRLVGWTNIQTGEVKSPFDEVRDALSEREPDLLDVGGYHLRAFAGIHYISTELICRMQSWPSRFGIIDFYLGMCKDMVIKGYEQENMCIIDVGKLASLSEAEHFLSAVAPGGAS